MKEKNSDMILPTHLQIVKTLSGISGNGIDNLMAIA